MDGDPVPPGHSLARRFLALTIVLLAVALAALLWRESSSPPAPVTAAAESPQAAHAPDQPVVAVGDDDASAGGPALARVQAPSRLDRHATPGQRRMSGFTHAADSTLGVRCTFDGLDAVGTPLGIEVLVAAAGVFSVRVPPEAVMLRVTPRRRYDLGVVEIPVPRTDTDDIDVLLPNATGLLKGQVVDQLGDGVEGIKVTLDGSHAYRTTDGNGAFHVGPLRDGSYAVAVANMPYTPGSNPRQDVELRDSRQMSEVLFVVERGATLIGRTVDQLSGEALCGVRLMLSHAGAREHRSTTSDADGEFLFPRLVGGTFNLVAVPSGGHGRADVTVADLVGSETREVEVRLSAAAGSLTGQITDGDDRPLPFATVIAERLGGDDGAAEQVSARSDTRGRYRIPSLPCGVWEVYVSPAWCESRNWIGADEHVLEITADHEATVDLRLRQGNVLRGRVVSMSERRDLEVRLRDGDGGISRKTMGRDGYFAFGGLRPTTYVLEAVDPRQPDAALASRQVYLPLSDPEPVELRVP